MQYDSLCQSLTTNECFHIHTGAEIEDQSCNGAYACNLSPSIVVEEGSCNVGYYFIGKTCALAPGAHIGKESCLGHYGEVLFKISTVALINSLCVYISILSRFINHHSKLVVSFAALLATTPAIVTWPAQMGREQFMMVPVVVPTAIISGHALLWPVSLEKDKRLPTSFCTF